MLTLFRAFKDYIMTFVIKEAFYIFRNKFLTPMSNQKYPDGYLPKIAYHMAHGNDDKSIYFIDQQIKKHGPLTPANKSRIMELIAEEVKS